MYILNKPYERRSVWADGNIGTSYLTLFAMVLSVILYGKLPDLLGGAAEAVRAATIFLTVAVTMTGAVICLLRGMILSAALTIMGLAWVFIYTVVYSLNTGVPYTLSAGGEFIGYTFFGLFALTLRDKTFGKLMWWFYIISCGYAVYYVTSSLAVQTGVIDIASTTRAVISADDAGRGNRLLATLVPLAFGIMYTFVILINAFKFRYLMVLGLFGLAWYLTFSRTVGVITIIVMLAYGLTRNIKLVSRVFLTTLVVATLFSLFLVLYPDYNPFYLAYDVSGMIRVMSVNSVSDLFHYYWLFGAGIAYGPEAYEPITGTKFFFPGDVGLIGMLFAYGVVGFPVYIFMMYCGFKAHRNVPSDPAFPYLGTALTLTGCVFGLYSLQSPQYDSGSPASVLGVAFVALALNQYSKSNIRQPARRPLRGRST